MKDRKSPKFRIYRGGSFSALSLFVLSLSLSRKNRGRKQSADGEALAVFLNPRGSGNRSEWIGLRDESPSGDSWEFQCGGGFRWRSCRMSGGEQQRVAASFKCSQQIGDYGIQVARCSNAD